MFWIYTYHDKLLFIFLFLLTVYGVLLFKRYISSWVWSTINAIPIVFKPNPVIDPVSWTGYGSDGLTRVSPGQPKKKKKLCFLTGFSLSIFSTLRLLCMCCSLAIYTSGQSNIKKDLYFPLRSLFLRLLLLTNSHFSYDCRVHFKALCFWFRWVLFSMAFTSCKATGLLS